MKKIMIRIHNLKNRIEIRKDLRKASTPQEIILWSRLRRKQLGSKFRRQHSIGCYVVDFYCSEKRIIIEIDGCQHKEKDQEEYDSNRTKFLESLKYKVLRFWNNEIDKNLEGVILKIKETL